MLGQQCTGEGLEGAAHPWASARSVKEQAAARELGRLESARWPRREEAGRGQREARGSGRLVLCSLLKNEQQKQRQVHGDAEDGAGEVLATGSVGTSEEKDSGESEAPPVDASEREGDV